LTKTKLSKEELRRQIKERWFDAGTAAFKKVCPADAAIVFPDLDNPTSAHCVGA
jgi:hypothetical protein